jgi:hypothetical protein
MEGLGAAAGMAKVELRSLLHAHSIPRSRRRCFYEFARFVLLAYDRQLEWWTQWTERGCQFGFVWKLSRRANHFRMWIAYPSSSNTKGIWGSHPSKVIDR